MQTMLRTTHAVNATQIVIPLSKLQFYIYFSGIQLNQIKLGQNV